MKLVLSIATILTLLCSTIAEPITNQVCTGKIKPESPVSSISLTPCPNGSGESGRPCTLKRGSSANLEILFHTTQVHKKLDAAINWMDGKEERSNFIPLASNQKNVCASMTPRSPLPCPTKTGNEYTWSPTFHVPFQTVGNYHLRLKFVDMDKNVICQEFHVRLESDEGPGPYCAVNKTKSCA